MSVAELVALAGVSKSSFYRHFADKEACFLATFEEVVELGATTVEERLGATDGIAGRLSAAAEGFAELVIEEETAARLVFISSLEVGAGAREARERSIRRFEDTLRRVFVESGSTQPTAMTLRGIVGGAHEVVYRRLRESAPEKLREDLPRIVDWVVRQRGREGQGPTQGERLVATAESATAVSGEEEPALAGWEASPRSRRARSELSQRDRILHATAQMVADEGYGAMSVESISTRAGVSNQTFYERFTGKEEAFLAAFDALALLAFRRTAEAFVVQEGWLHAGAAGMVALLRHFAHSPLHRRLVFSELVAAGPSAMERAEGMLDAFIGFLEPEALPPEIRERPPRAVLEAVAGGLWAIIQREVDEGRGDDLVAGAPALIDFVLTPFAAE